MDTSRLHDLAISDSGFVFDPLTGYTFTVNPTGLLVLLSLKQGIQPDELAAKVEEQYELEGGEDVGRDVSEFVTSLRTMGLVK